MNSPLTLSVADAAVAPGEELVVVATVATEDAVGLSVELLYANEYKYRGKDSGLDSRSTSTLESVIDIGVAASGGPEETTQAEVVVAEFMRTASDGPLAGEHQLRLPIPVDAPPSVAGLVQWKLRAITNRRGDAPDLAESDVTISSTPATGAGEVLRVPNWDDQIDLIVPQRAVHAGETINGTVVIVPEKSGKVTDVRIALESVRVDEDDISLTSTVSKVQLAGRTSLEQGVRQELSFSVPVPAEALPSFTTGRNQLGYRLQVSAARRMRGDFNEILKVYVASPRS
jgi:hypothetical protein